MAKEIKFKISLNVDGKEQLVTATTNARDFKKRVGFPVEILSYYWGNSKYIRIFAELGAFGAEGLAGLGRVYFAGAGVGEDFSALR